MKTNVKNSDRTPNFAANVTEMQSRKVIGKNRNITFYTQE